MSLSFECPHCACAYRLEQSCAGQRLNCRQCGQQFQVPGSLASHPDTPAPGGPVALRQEERSDMPMLTPTPTQYLRQITRHIERTVGPSPMVFHEIISTDIHLDLHIVPPQRGPATSDHPHGREFYTIVTSGMSSRPMTPADQSHPDCPRYAELMLTLPGDWPGLRPDGTFIQEYMHDEANWWPLRWLKLLARMPHEQDTCLCPGCTIPNGQHAEPFAAGTRFGGMMMQPSEVHPRARRLVVHDDVAIDFLALWPLYPEEMRYKQDHGLAALTAALQRHGIVDVVDRARPNVARER